MGGERYFYVHSSILQPVYNYKNDQTILCSLGFGDKEMRKGVRPPPPNSHSVCWDGATYTTSIFHYYICITILTIIIIIRIIIIRVP